MTGVPSWSVTECPLFTHLRHSRGLDFAAVSGRVFHAKMLSMPLDINQYGAGGLINRLPGGATDLEVSS